MNFNILRKSLAAVALSAMLVGCTGTVTVNTWGPYSSPSVTASSFISALNNVDGATFPFDSFMVKDQWDTVRNDETWFVIYDAQYDEHVAVSLEYLRTIVYYAYYSSNNNLAGEFRAIQSDDQFFNGLIGDGLGNNYEIVDYAFTDIFGEDFYVGYDSGLLYEDQAQSFDVSMMAGEKENLAFYQKAANVSFAYNLGIETSMALVTLGQKVEQMMDKSRGEITLEDQAVIMGDISHLAGVTLGDINKAANDSKARTELIENIADRIGTSAGNLEQRILPELFGIQL